ncbi:MULTISPECIES: YbcC family protein [Marinomonas]|uniref:Probable inorganic carbon transporter subunit DabA n=1 Tax=Marinomonas rhodophyticola TaxID=2992803 RepID=A0ABT3KGR0_9GAMM|nr:DUF2309 domain-containing protein [Marinomonas sp. KJ51-3]MCW4629705.1 DUF2309 domain-containing protein [Marinomonas sp. KJ51-3]
MNAAISATQSSMLTEKQMAILQSAGQHIAPTWPLDQMIAVNPFWPMRHQPIERVSAILSTLGGAQLLMPSSYYLQGYQSGEISSSALIQAAQAQGTPLKEEALVAFLQEDTATANWHNISDLLDNQRDPHKMAWRDEITHQISQFCAAHYQQLRPILGRQDTAHQPDLYQHWLDVTRRDKGLSIILDEPGLQALFQQLPDTPEQVIAQAIETLTLSDDLLSHYAHALLLDINGWGSWVAYLRWQGELYDQPHDDMLALLAIRMAWELVIWRYYQAKDPDTAELLKVLWTREKHQLPDLIRQQQNAQRLLWVWAKAAEISYQQRLNHTLLTAKPQPAVQTPILQAAFCIDVRSEVMRRALEAQSDHIQTLGFAGFFGLPLEYQPQASALSRPQLPGLLKPAIRATEAIASDNQSFNSSSVIKTAVGLNKRARWHGWSQAAPSTFSMVESMGWLYAFKMLKKSFFSSSGENPLNRLSHHHKWTLTKEDKLLTLEEKAGLAKGILHAMGLTHFAKTILLVGHGSHSTNNLHAAGLDCGACGGQTGEINVRVLAQLLNDQAVRAELRTSGVDIPDSSRFVAALHNTTTDHISCFDDNVEENVCHWLNAATKKAQRERILQIDPTLLNANDDKLNKAYLKRSQDWSQVRPEWGLANNAAFIVAPRNWTRQVDLQGRSFLHDYQWQNDTGFNVLELIMTAPMIVTNWINMQYNASVTDPLKYGSGNKVLHNAVGGNIGVFEGNGGDLRIGLSLQSLHNGEKWMHQPQRLTVYIAAPREAIEQVTAKHDNVRYLIDNEWLYLLRWDEKGTIERFYQQTWEMQV